MIIFNDFVFLLNRSRTSEVKSILGLLNKKIFSFKKTTFIFFLTDTSLTTCANKSFIFF